MRIYDKTKFIPNNFLNVTQKTVNRSVRAHGHEFFEIEFFLKGEGVHMIDGVAYPIRPNALFLLSPANVHGINTKEAEVITVMFQCEYSGGFFSFPSLSLSHSPAFYFEAREQQLIRSLLEEIYLTHERDDTYAMMLLHCVLHKLNSIRTSDTKEMLPMVQNIILYILENFRGEVTLERTAVHFGFSRSYLSEFFLQETGHHFKTYLDGIRFSHAQNLLAFTELPVCEVHACSGFPDYANFARRFKARFGVTPTEYRKRAHTREKTVN